MPSVKFNSTVEYHDIQRMKICLICLKKKKLLFEIKDALREKIEKIVSFYNASDEKLPKVICSVCKTVIYSSLKKKENKIKLPDFSKFNYTQHSTRAKKNKKSECYLCELVTTPGHINFSKNYNVSNKNKKLIYKKCKICKVKAKINHFCCSEKNLKTFQENVLSTLPLAEKEKLASALLKEIQNDKKNSENQSKNEMTLSQKHGKPLRIMINPNKE